MAEETIVLRNHKDTVLSIEPDIIALAQLVYPKKENRSAVDTLNQVLTDNGLLDSYIPASKDEINLMTLHKSKGLEFNIVFHMDLYRWIIPCAGMNYPFALHPNTYRKIFS